MTDLIEALTADEADQLAQCEAVIARGLKTFIEVGGALLDVRDNNLHRADFPTFEAYCSDRWGISRTRAYELMGAANVVSAIADKIEVAPPSNEAQARELAKLPEADRADVWTKAHEATDGKPTAAAVRAAANPQTTDGPPSVEAETTSAAADGLGETSPSTLGGPDGDDEAGDSGLPPQVPESPAEESALFEDEEAADRRRDDELDNAMDGTATRFRRNFSGALASSTALWNFDPERIAEVYGADFDHSVRAVLDQMAAWTEKVYAARRRSASGLRLVSGGGGK
jgi:hypothetical protein